MRRFSRHAFTLLELLMVIALLGIVVLLGWPDLTAPAAAERLKESAQRMKALVAMCRAEAMNQTTRYRIKFRPDGSVRVQRQADALRAPHLYISVPVDWARRAVVLDDVWVEAIQYLPEGPPPIRIIDERLMFPETVLALTPVEEFPSPVWIDFEPDGSSNGLRWVLRDVRGAGLLLTLDGRMGRVLMEEWPAQLPDAVQRPEPLPEDEEVAYDPGDYL